MMDYKRLACQIRTYEEGDLYEQPAFPVADEVTSSMSGKRSKSCAKEEINPNVLMVKFSVIGECHDVHTGDPVVCQKKGCTAILNHLSKMTEQPEGKSSVWVCEFCGTKNEAVVIPEEVPQSEEVLFVGCAPGPAANADAKGGLVVFCVDTSGSMGVTTEVPGRFDLRGHDDLKQLQQMYGMIGEDSSPPENITYVSRLQSVQAAVDHQLQAIAQNNSAQRVALVTFGDEVVVIGDGKSEDVVIAGDRLCSYNALVKCSAELPVPSPIRETRGVLKEKLFDIVPDGQTALGPALVISIKIAGQAPGSKVIICTDGLANRGVGNLEGQGDVRAFYKKVGEEARDKSVTVSVITIKGTTCNLFDLGQVGQITGGQVTIKDPVNIAQEFANMLVNPFIATGVNVKIVLHTGLFIKSDDSQESILKVSVGNVTESSELIHEFGMKQSFFLQYIQPFYAQEEGSTSSVGDSVHLPPPNFTDGKPHVPLQLQIKYTNPTGQQYLLVITKSRSIAPDQQTAMQGMDMQIMGCHFVRKVAELGTEGKFEEAQENAARFQRMLKDHRYTSPKERRICQQLDDMMAPLQSAVENLTPSARKPGKPRANDSSSFELYQAAKSPSARFGTFDSDEDDGEESEVTIVNGEADKPEGIPEPVKPEGMKPEAVKPEAEKLGGVESERVKPDNGQK